MGSLSNGVIAPVGFMRLLGFSFSNGGEIVRDM